MLSAKTKWFQCTNCTPSLISKSFTMLLILSLSPKMCDSDL